MQEKEKNNLLSIQRRFRETIKAPQTKLGLATPWLKDTPTVDLDTRVGIYTYAYWARLIESLEEDFPLTRKKIGKKPFSTLARHYIEAQPSTFSSLAEVSRDFPSFISKTDMAAQIPFIEDLAKFEWHKILSSLAQEKPSNLSALANVPLQAHGRIRFRLSASLFILSVRYPVLKGPTPQDILLYSKLGIPHYESLENAEMVLLDSIKKGMTLSKLQDLSLELKLSPEKTAQYFQNWSNSGVIVGFDL